MSCIYICDRCGKTIDTSEGIVPKGDGIYEIVQASRIKLSEGLRDCDLCLSCKTELYDWLHDPSMLLTDEKIEYKEESK